MEIQKKEKQKSVKIQTWNMEILKNMIVEKWDFGKIKIWKNGNLEK